MKESSLDLIQRVNILSSVSSLIFPNTFMNVINSWKLVLLVTKSYCSILNSFLLKLLNEIQRNVRWTVESFHEYNQLLKADYLWPNVCCYILNCFLFKLLSEIYEILWTGESNFTYSINIDWSRNWSTLKFCFSWDLFFS